MYPLEFMNYRFDAEFHAPRHWATTLTLAMNPRFT